MNVLFVTLANISNVLDSGLYQDLIKEFIKHNHNIFVVSPSERRNKAKTRVYISGQSRILKVKTGNIQKCNFVEKGISTILIDYQYKAAIKKHFKSIKFDLILYSTPPITLLKVINFIKKRDNAKSYLLLRDIFPQNAVDLKMFSKKSLIYKYFRMKEKNLYKSADYIGCLSPANVDFVLKYNLELNKNNIHVCANGINPLEILVTKEQKELLRKKYDIPLNKIVFVYGGNLGKPQDINYIINCLKSQKDNDRAFFLIIGSGTEYKKLEKFALEEKQQNVKLLRSLPKNEYDYMIACCDVGLIFLDHRFTIPNYPSRILSYMQVKIPVFAVTDKNTDIGKTIADGDFGWWCESNNVEEFSKLITIIMNSELTQKGQKARAFLEENFTAEKSYEIIMGNVKK